MFLPVRQNCVSTEQRPCGMTQNRWAAHGFIEPLISKHESKPDTTALNRAEITRFPSLSLWTLVPIRAVGAYTLQININSVRYFTATYPRYPASTKNCYLTKPLFPVHSLFTKELLCWGNIVTSGESRSHIFSSPFPSLFFLSLSTSKSADLFRQACAFAFFFKRNVAVISHAESLTPALSAYINRLIERDMGAGWSGGGVSKS